MADYQPVSCDLYDWLEIAASWQLPVTLTAGMAASGRTRSAP